MTGLRDSALEKLAAELRDQKDSYRASTRQKFKGSDLWYFEGLQTNETCNSSSKTTRNPNTTKTKLLKGKLGRKNKKPEYIGHTIPKFALKPNTTCEIDTNNICLASLKSQTIPAKTVHVLGFLTSSKSHMWWKNQLVSCLKFTVSASPKFQHLMQDADVPVFASKIRIARRYLLVKHWKQKKVKNDRAQNSMSVHTGMIWNYRTPKEWLVKVTTIPVISNHGAQKVFLIHTQNHSFDLFDHLISDSQSPSALTAPRNAYVAILMRTIPDKNVQVWIDLFASTDKR